MTEGESSSSEIEDEDVLPWWVSAHAAATDPALLEHTGALVAEPRIRPSAQSSAVQGEIHLVSGQSALAILQPDPAHSEGEGMATAREVSVAELWETLEYLVGEAAEEDTDGRS